MIEKTKVKRKRARLASHRVKDLLLSLRCWLLVETLAMTSREAGWVVGLHPWSVGRHVKKFKGLMKSNGEIARQLLLGVHRTHEVLSIEDAVESGEVGSRLQSGSAQYDPRKHGRRNG